MYYGSDEYSWLIAKGRYFAWRLCEMEGKRVTRSAASGSNASGRLILQVTTFLRGHQTFLRGSYVGFILIAD